MLSDERGAATGARAGSEFAVTSSVAAPRVEADGVVVPAGPSEFAREVALLARHLDPEGRALLRQLLGQELAVPPVGSLREAKLGLLMDLVSDGSGIFPTVDDYNAARARRAELGEAHPSHAMLIDHFRDWLSAVRAATKLVVHGTSARVPASRQAWSQLPAPYSRDDILRVILQCADSMGEWPSDVLFTEWCRTVRELAMAAGRLADIRVPRRKALVKHFGTYANASNAAARARAEGRL